MRWRRCCGQDCLGERGSPRKLVLICAGGLLFCGLFCVLWHGHEGLRLIPFAMKMMTIAYGGLVGVFIAALLPGKRSGLAGLLALAAGVLMILSGEFFWIEQLGFIWRFALACLVATLVALLPLPDLRPAEREQNDLAEAP